MAHVCTLQFYVIRGHISSLFCEWSILDYDYNVSLFATFTPYIVVPYDQLSISTAFTIHSSVLLAVTKRYIGLLGIIHNVHCFLVLLLLCLSELILFMYLFYICIPFLLNIYTC